MMRPTITWRGSRWNDPVVEDGNDNKYDENDDKEDVVDVLPPYYPVESSVSN